ncbi:zinc finger protein [Actinosynnema sp. CS-041913]|uniref:zinc finger protein n=1 Tax=Actinosynnema sp. CS-041913 TaxID=3239917 RepID=UPI003D8B7C19
MTRAFRWMPHDGRRHAIRSELAPREEGATLCGLPLTVPPSQSYVNWCWPTCADCDVAWRTHEGIAVFPGQRTDRPDQPACAR